MKDVAAVADVSLATVSRVVNGNDDVNADLRERVERAVELLGYRRDIVASALRRSDALSATIGLVLEDVSNPFFASVYRGVEDAARARGVLALAGSSDDDAERERELADGFCARRVDGLLIAVSGRGDESHLARDRAAGVPVVFVDRPPRSLKADVVLVDNAGGMATAVEHLLAHGHRRIGYLGDRQRVFTAAERLRGYTEALSHHGIAVDEALIRLELADSKSACAAAAGLLSSPDPPSALVGGQNLITIGALRALREHGRQHEVAIVGFDDVALGDLIDPGVTVMAQDPVEIGRRAADLLFARIDGDDRRPVRIVLPTRLLARGSGEIPAGGVRSRAAADAPAGAGRAAAGPHRCRRHALRR